MYFMDTIQHTKRFYVLTLLAALLFGLIGGYYYGTKSGYQKGVADAKNQGSVPIQQ